MRPDDNLLARPLTIFHAWNDEVSWDNQWVQQPRMCANQFQKLFAHCHKKWCVGRKNWWIAWQSKMLFQMEHAEKKILCLPNPGAMDCYQSGNYFETSLALLGSGQLQDCWPAETTSFHQEHMEVMWVLQSWFNWQCSKAWKTSWTKGFHEILFFCKQIGINEMIVPIVCCNCVLQLCHAVILVDPSSLWWVCAIWFSAHWHMRTSWMSLIPSPALIPNVESLTFELEVCSPVTCAKLPSSREGGCGRNVTSVKKQHDRCHQKQTAVTQQCRLTAAQCSDFVVQKQFMSVIFRMQHENGKHEDDFCLEKECWMQSKFFAIICFYKIGRIKWIKSEI